MSGQRTSFGKLQRDRAKKEKAAAKRERRQERVTDPDGPGSPSAAAEADPAGDDSADHLLGLIESVHQRFEAGTMSYDDFEQQKAELLARLPID